MGTLLSSLRELDDRESLQHSLTHFVATVYHFLKMLSPVLALVLITGDTACPILC